MDSSNGETGNHVSGEIRDNSGQAAIGIGIHQSHISGSGGVMGSFWKAALGVAGLGAIGAFLFYSLYKDWLHLPIFAQMDKGQTFIVMLVFLSLTFLALVVILVTYIFTRKQT